ncbi:copper chaperone PCu(A)C [uncultured Sphingomonas sp.]|uniref:copper chaperone PCu(A)C n=1 Tax=uncultured Sphingomonas sp. TaxID=158754 RepID=UPI0035CA42AD
MSRLMRSGAAALLLFGCSGPGEVTVDDAWVRLPAAPGRPGAGYLTVHGGATDRTLVRVTADYALRSEMHESMGTGSRMSMRPLARVAVPADGEVVFAPGGRHLMLYDLDARAKPGTSTLLTLTFENGERLYRKAYIIGPGDPAPE